MLKIGVLVSGGGTNLQAILDAVKNHEITNARVELVISNNAGAYALTRAREHGVEAVCVSPKDYDSRGEFHKALLKKLQDSQVDLVVLAGFLVAIPEMIVNAYPNRIINIHPSLIPSFCGEGDRRHGAFRGRRNRYRAHSFAEGSGSTAGRYAGDPSAPGDGGGRVEASSQSHRFDRK